MGFQPAPGPALVGIKLLHTLVWLFFVVCIVAIPIAAKAEQFQWVLILSGLVGVECLVLATNQGRCPFTDMAGRYTDARQDNFDIYLPLWLARYNKHIFGTLFVLGELYALKCWISAGR